MILKSKLLANMTIASCLLCAGCSGSQSPQAEGPTQATGTAMQAAAVDPCGGVTPAQAASILHISANDIVGPAHLDTFSCSYHSGRKTYTSLDFNLCVTPSSAMAANKLDAMKENLGFLSSAVTVPDLGDEAWYFPDPRVRRLLMRKDAVWLDVTTPGDKASQLQIARIVLTHLP